MSLKAGMLQNIRSSHDRMKDLVEQALLQSKGKEKQQRELYRDLRREITLHGLLAEDGMLGTLKSMPGNIPVTSAFRIQLAQLEGFVNKLDARSAGTFAWVETLLQLKQAIHEHESFEESTLLPFLRGAAA